MGAFEILGEPVRRRILEILSKDEYNAGELVTIIHDEFGISQAAVSQHLKVLREFGFVEVRAEGNAEGLCFECEAIPGGGCLAFSVSSFL